MFLLTNCASSDDDVDAPAPTIELKKAEGYTSETELVLKENESAKFGFTARNAGGVKLSKFEILKGDELLDSEPIDNDTVYIERTFTKDASEEEKYIFKVINSKEKETVLEITLKLDPTPTNKKLMSHANVILGGQNNMTIGSYYSILNNTIYKQQEAENNQNIVDMIYFHGAENHTIASPKIDTEGDILGVNNWTTKNEILFVKANITEAEFDAAQDDKIIIDNMNEANLAQKATNLKAGGIYFFKHVTVKKIGLIKIKSVDGAEAGTVTFDAKIQE